MSAMARQPKLDHVKWVRSKGRVYPYFNTGQQAKGKPIYERLPDPSTAEFYASYAKLKAARENRALPGNTVAKIAREYEYSPVFRALASNSQLAYSQTLRRIVGALGKFPVDALESCHVQAVLDTAVPGAASHNLFVAVLGTMYKWARKRNLTTAQPTKDIERRKGGEHKPWPLAALKAGLAAEDDQIRLAVRLLYFTGQRIGDVLAMRWADVEDNEISIVQEKTGKQVWIQLHRDLRSELAKAPKRGITILADDVGRPYRVEVMRRALQEFTGALGFKTVPHGLRKNAVNALLEVGCGVPEVSAITGQTYAVVEHYAKQVNTRKLASAAIIKLENRRGTGKR